MKTTASTLFFVLALSFFVQAQNWCGTDAHLAKQLEENPELRAKMEQDLLDIQEKIEENAVSGRTAAVVHTIPVVVHVIHYNGAGNISLEQIQSGIDVLNEDFRRLNADAASTRSVFLPYAADAEFEFRLAQIDPDGNCTNGVERVESQLTLDADNDVKALSYWPSNQYLNFWVVENIAGGGDGSIILGYAQFPFSGINSTYGIVIRNDAFGRIGTSNEDGRTATHEVGHCLGLFHTFQSGCGSSCSSSGDQICDTPPVIESSFNCSFSNNTCSNDNVGPSPYTDNVPDQIENYMSYNSCQNMYSLGQKDRMKGVIDNYTALQNLTSMENLMATGVFLDPILCRADFEAEQTTICVGQSIAFEDLSFSGQTEWSWEFEGGEPAASSDESPTVTYNNPGSYNVQLVVGNGTDQVDTIKETYITVLETIKENPYQESFESIASLPSDEWSVYNPDGTIGWEIEDDAGFSGDQSIRLRNFYSTPGSIDEIISVPMDLSDLEDVTLSFKYAFAKRNDDNNDRLRIWASNDCGMSWSIRKVLQGSSFPTVDNMSSPFTPSDASEWKETSVTNLSASYLVDGFQFKLSFEGDGGNNIYIDDINIDGPVGIAEQVFGVDDVAIFPNPVINQSQIRFTTPAALMLQVELINSIGARVRPVFSGNLSAGEQQLTLDASGLPPGIYWVAFSSEEGVFAKAVVLE